MTNERKGAVTHLVRATQEPGVVREVTDAELLDLHRQGILHSYEHTDEALIVLGGTVKTPGKWKAPDKGEETVAAPPAVTDTEGA
jgi:hypothetical protein